MTSIDLGQAIDESSAIPDTQGYLDYSAKLEPTHRPPACDYALAKMLDANPDSSVILGRNMFLGPIRAATSQTNVDVQQLPSVPSDSCFVFCTGGAPPRNLKGSVELESSVTIYVRSNPNDYEGGWALARNVWFHTHNRRPAQYYSCVCLTSEPMYYQSDDANRHIWAINVQMMRGLI